MQSITILLTRDRMQPEDEAEVEEGEKGIEDLMGMLAVRTRHGSEDLVVARSVRVAFS